MVSSRHQITYTLRGGSSDEEYQEAFSELPTSELAEHLGFPPDTDESIMFALMCAVLLDTHAKKTADIQSIAKSILTRLKTQPSIMDHLRSRLHHETVAPTETVAPEGTPQVPESVLPPAASHEAAIEETPPQTPEVVILYDSQFEIDKYRDCLQEIIGDKYLLTLTTDVSHIAREKAAFFAWHAIGARLPASYHVLKEKCAQLRIPFGVITLKSFSGQDYKGSEDTFVFHIKSNGKSYQLQTQNSQNATVKIDIDLFLEEVTSPFRGGRTIIILHHPNTAQALRRFVHNLKQSGVFQPNDTVRMTTDLNSITHFPNVKAAFYMNVNTGRFDAKASLMKDFFNTTQAAKVKSAYIGLSIGQPNDAITPEFEGWSSFYFYLLAGSYKIIEKDDQTFYARNARPINEQNKVALKSFLTD